MNLLGFQISKLQTSVKLGLLAREFLHGRNATGIAQFRVTVKMKTQKRYRMTPGGLPVKKKRDSDENPARSAVVRRTSGEIPAMTSAARVPAD